MKVTIRRSGGFAGIREEFGPYDTANLAAEKKKRVEDLLASVFEAARTDEPPVGADFILIELRVMREGSSNRIATVDDGDLARPVLEHLRRLFGVLGIPGTPVMENTR